MISNQNIQISIDELKAITKVDLCVFDAYGKLHASTWDAEEIDSDVVTAFATSPADSQVMGPHHLIKVMDREEVLFVVVTTGTGEEKYTVGRIAASQLKNLAAAYKDRFDRNGFFQNLLMDNLLLVDIYNKAKRLHVEDAVSRAIFLIEPQGENDPMVTELLKGMFSDVSGDYVTAVDENSVILIKTIENPRNAEEINSIAQTIVAMMNVEAMRNVKVAVGTVVDELKSLSKSYKEAKMALDVGKIFYAQKDVITYGALGIGRLIYQLPVNLCKIFIQEVFPDGVPEELDDETLSTINTFFDNNLNVSETSRQLFLHRNTLVYRIEKLQKALGLDLRNFDDALTFKIALMVVNYITFLEENR
ncbi:MAG: helix-turn-helix domain-containing protein [Lachnospiraceae bacterium]|nr:helix-turn-helix domain-containing protein [Lachnospiraceae bacterium]